MMVVCMRCSRPVEVPSLPETVICADCLSALVNTPREAVAAEAKQPIKAAGACFLFGQIFGEAEGFNGQVFDIEGLRGAMEEVLGTLSERERLVLELRYGLRDGQPRTLEAVGKVPQIGVSRERVRAIEGKALRKLRHPTRSRLIGSMAFGGLLRNLAREVTEQLEQLERLKSAISRLREGIEEEVYKRLHDLGVPAATPIGELNLPDYLKKRLKWAGLRCAGDLPELLAGRRYVEGIGAVTLSRIAQVLAEAGVEVGACDA